MALTEMVRWVLIILLLWGGFSYGQNQLTSLIAPGGGSYQNDVVRGIWTVGEVAGGAASTNGITTNQGFIPPQVLLTITGSDQQLEEELFKLYPNPANEFFIIKWDAGVNSAGVTYKLFDSKGILLEMLRPNGASPFQKVSMTGYASGVYLLIIEGNSSMSNKKLKITKAYAP